MFELAKSEENHISLAVLIHAFTLGPESMSHVENSVRYSKNNVHVIAPKLPLGMFSTADANVLAWRVLDEIESQVRFRADNKWPEFEEIVFIGHSFGALIARKVYVLACGETPEAPFEGHEEVPKMERREWTDRVTRLILLAGMNRGWSITHHLSVRKAIQLSLGSVLGHILLSVFKKRLVIFQARRGSTFLTQLRLQWLALAANLRREGIRMATTIQLLGTIDDLVSPDDNIDLVTGRDFLYLDVPHSGHTNVIELDGTVPGGADGGYLRPLCWKVNKRFAPVTYCRRIRLWPRLGQKLRT